MIKFFSLSRKSDLHKIEDVILMLARYHAVKPDNESFRNKYRHLFAMYYNLCDRAGVSPNV